MNKANIEKAPPPYNAKHITEKAAASSKASKKRCSCPAGQADGLATRRRQLPRTSRTRQRWSKASARTWPLSADSQFLQKEIDTQDMNIVVAASTQGSMRQFLERSRRHSSNSSRRPSRSSSRQHSMMSNMMSNILRVKQISIGVNKIGSDIAGSKQEKCDEILNEMKSMLIETCWKKNFIENNTQPAEAVGATKCSQNSTSRRAGVSAFSHSNDRESRNVVEHETRTRAEGCNHVDLVWTTTRH